MRELRGREGDQAYGGAGGTRIVAVSEGRWVSCRYESGNESRGIGDEWVLILR